MIVLKSDGREFANLGNLYAAAGKDAPRAVRLAVKEVGMKARTGMRRGVRAELGAQHKIASQVNKRIVGRIVSGGLGAEYHITARGNIPLKHFRTVQSPSGVSVPGVKKEFIEGADKLPKAFEATTGHAGTRGNRAKRRKTLGGRIVYSPKGTRKVIPVKGVSVPKVFLSQKPVKAFEEAARELPPKLARILLAAINGQLRAHRGAKP